MSCATVVAKQTIPHHEAEQVITSEISNVSCIRDGNQSKAKHSTAKTSEQTRELSTSSCSRAACHKKTSHSLLLRIVFGTVSHNNLDLGPRKASIHHISAHILFWTTRHAHFQHNTPRQWLTQRRTLFTLHCQGTCTCFHHVFIHAMCTTTTSHRRRPNGFSQCSGACVANAVLPKVQNSDGPVRLVISYKRL